MLSISLAVMAELTAKKDNITATTIRNMSFGAFFNIGAGGTITISADGSRSVSGDILYANLMPYSPVIFEIEGPVNTYVYIQNGPDVNLKAGKKGGTVTLHLENATPESPFILKNASSGSNTAIQQVSMGGTLIIKDANNSPAGNYSGTFSITFIQQ
ncbi:MAG: DUF4402 domain-containing protein [Bacteroidales bacterium]|nr:DUF4402 domain-containing protein [Bacteroidales bacterium]